MDRVEKYAVLGAHQHGDEVGLYDAADVILQTDDARMLVFGVRTAGFIRSIQPGAWLNDYSPIPMSFDLQERRFWDFGSILWLGPEPHPCLLWSNAAGLSDKGLSFLVSAHKMPVILAGRNGSGLPEAAALGVRVEELDLSWVPVADWVPLTPAASGSEVNS